MTASLSREELCSVMDRVQVAVLVRSGMAGSVFLHGLFDQHEEVATAPTLWVYDFYSHDDAVLSPETYLDLVVRNTAYLFDLKRWFDPEGVRKAMCEIDREAFCALFFSLCQTYGPCGRREYFLLFHIALFLLRGRKIENLKLILAYFHGAVASVCMERKPQGERVAYMPDPEKIFQDFPEVRFISLIRNPIYELESTRGERRWSPHALILFLIHRVLFWNQVYFTLSSGCPVFMLKTPDLHQHFDAVMKALSAFLGLTYNPSLRESTFWGNAFAVSGKQKVLTNGPNPDFIDYKGLLSGYEISIPRFFFRDPIARFFPEAVVPTQWTDRPKRWGFYVLCVLYLCRFRDLLTEYRDCFPLFLRYYPTLKKFRSLDISHVQTYKNMGTEA